MSRRALKSKARGAPSPIPPVPVDEPERLAALYRTGILDTGSDPSFDRLTRLAASLFGTRYAFLSFVDRTRQWLKSEQGLGIAESARDIAFCAYTILGQDVMVVDDARQDTRFEDNPFVTASPHLRFYAGVPVKSAGGHNIGTLCIADTQPRAAFADTDKLLLAELAEIASEMTEEHRAGRELRRAEQDARERYALVTSATLDGVWDWDLSRNIVYYSTRWQAIVGLEARECFASLFHWIDHVHPEDRTSLLKTIDDQMLGLELPFRHEHRIQTGEGAWRWVVVRGLTQRDAAGRPTRMAGSMMDVTPDKTLDGLTGLPNRLIVHDRLSRLIERSRASGEWRFAVLFLDLDHFNEVNTCFGSAAGDRVLISVAARIAAVVAKTRKGGHSIVARGVGDEFIVVLDGVHTVRQAEGVARRLHAAISAPIGWRNDFIESHVSIGIAMGTGKHETPEEHLQNADLAMYAARTTGRGGTAVCDEVMQRRNALRLKTESMLRYAVALGELRLYYQPQIDLRTGALVGCEALVRWDNPELGQLQPDVFIPMAEKLGMIAEIDRWVLASAAEQIAAWRASFPAASHWHMSVNISAEQFPNRNLIHMVEETLEQHGLPPSVLCIEITETALMRHVARGADTMQSLRRMGVGLHMDDFGAGYNSFKQLYELPFDTLKIDRSFLEKITTDPQAVDVLRGIVGLAKSLKLSSIAEGVETTEQEDLLRGLGCDWAQGFLYSKPLRPEDFTTLYLASAAR